jgi:hypothetical protein
MLVVNFCGVQQRIFLGCRIPEKFAGMVTHGSNASAYQRNSLARFSLHHSVRTREIRWCAVLFDTRDILWYAHELAFDNIC